MAQFLSYESGLSLTYTTWGVSKRPKTQAQKLRQGLSQNWGITIVSHKQ